MVKSHKVFGTDEEETAFSDVKLCPTCGHTLVRVLGKLRTKECLSHGFVSLASIEDGVMTLVMEPYKAHE